MITFAGKYRKMNRKIDFFIPCNDEPAAASIALQAAKSPAVRAIIKEKI